MNHNTASHPDQPKPEQPPTQKASPQKTKWGFGRVAFNAHLETIEAMHEQGFPVTHIYRELEDKLGGLSYPQFAYHLRKHNQDTPNTHTSVKKATAPSESKQLPEPSIITKKDPVSLNNPHPLPDDQLF